MPGTNIEMLQIIAGGLDDLKDDFVFVGGAVTELYVDDVKSYLRTEFQSLSENHGLSEGIEVTLPYGSDSARVEIIENLISEIAEIE